MLNTASMEQQACRVFIFENQRNGLFRDARQRALARSRQENGQPKLTYGKIPTDERRT